MRNIQYCLSISSLFLLSLNSSFAEVAFQKPFSELGDFLAEFQKEESIEIVSLMLINPTQSQGIYTHSLNPETQFTAQSPIPANFILEPLTSLLAYSLESQGKIELNEPVKRTVNDFKTGHGDQGRSLTWNHLLNQTAGFASTIDTQLAEDWTIPQDVFTLFKQGEIRNQAGAVYETSQASIAAVAYLLGKCTARSKQTPAGLAFEQALGTNLFNPLSMRNTRISWKGALLNSQKIVSTIEDLSQWIQLELNQGRLPDGSFLIEPSRMMERQSRFISNNQDVAHLGWYQRIYQEASITARAAKDGDHNLLIGYIGSQKIGFILYLKGSEKAASNLFKEVPLAICELSK